MKVSKVTYKEINESTKLLKKFIDYPDNSSLISAYIYMVELLYNYMKNDLLVTSKKYDKNDSGDERRYYKYNLFNNYLTTHDISIRDSSLNNLLTIRNRLVHETDFIFNIRKSDIGEMPDYISMLTLSTHIYDSNICAEFLIALTNFTIGVNPDGYVEESDSEVEDFNNINF